MMQHWMFNHGWPIGPMIFWLLILLFAVVLVVWLLRSRSAGESAPLSAEEILRQRYARGEIDRAEFEEKLADLRS